MIGCKLFTGTVCIYYTSVSYL